MLDIPGMAMDVSLSLQTDSGCVRDSNEDSGITIVPRDPGVLAKKGRLTVIADGMGGHSGGEIASKLAVSTITRVYYEVDQEPRESLRTAFAEANREIFEASTADQELQGMGTTCTALVVCGKLAISAHVGDSRLYLLRGGAIYLMTEDHSAVMEMVKNGIINVEEARHHEDKNVILRAVGTAPEVEVAFWDNPLAIQSGDQFILCSDGLSDLVEDRDITESVLSSTDAHTACAKLIDLAKQRGGYDNITVAIVSIEAANNVAQGKPPETREAEVFV